MATPTPRLNFVMVEAEEVKALLSSHEAHDPGFVGMQLQTQLRQDRAHPSLRLFRVRTAGAEYDEVVCVTHKHPKTAACSRPGCIQHMERHIRKQWGNHPPTK